MVLHIDLDIHIHMGSMVTARVTARVAARVTDGFPLILTGNCRYCAQGYR